jgi:hypothetical protein
MNYISKLHNLSYLTNSQMASMLGGIGWARAAHLKLKTLIFKNS